MQTNSQNPHSKDFQARMRDARGPNHYKFVAKPNPAKAELAIGTMIGGLSLPHVTIECSAQDFAHARTQQWICEVIIPRLEPTATLVIVVLPRIGL